MLDPILYLASDSPRRHEILKQLNIDHQVIQVPTPPGEDEPRIAGESPQDYVRRTANEKALRAAEFLKRTTRKGIAGVYILTADTTVILEDQILGKPRNRSDAAATLRSLSGKVHHVHTALALYHDEKLLQGLSVSTVHFKELSGAEINTYCATDDPMGKAGAYGIQGPAAAFISHLSGSYTGVMGLPAYETTELLTMAGFTARPALRQ